MNASVLIRINITETRIKIIPFVIITNAGIIIDSDKLTDIWMIFFDNDDNSLDGKNL